MGVGHMLDHFRDHAPDKLDHCTLLFMEPERGVTVNVADVCALFERRYPQVAALGTLPRDPRLASRADEHDGYIAMLDIGPHSAFAVAAHRVVDALCARLGLSPALPLPRVSLWQRLNARFRPDRSSAVPQQQATST
jgi:hypothetical protein